MTDGGKGITAQVFISEMMGSEYQVHVKVNEKDVIIRVPVLGIDKKSEQAIANGENVTFSFTPEVMHLFDKETGESLL